MTKQDVLLQSNLPLPPFIKGKVRDTYTLDDHLLIVASDRISAFDVVLPCGIPAKGAVLTQLSAFWFEKTQQVIPNHMVEVVSENTDLTAYADGANMSDFLRDIVGRSMIVKRAERLAVECVARGFLAGSGWAEYKKQGTVCGVNLPAGLQESEQLPEPIFTPTTKADTGHDMPMTFTEVQNQFGAEMAQKLKDTTLALYNFARDYARTRGFIIADTKMEFGIRNGELILIDELLTPDSSRFWDVNLYKAGQAQDSFDKQPVRDWLENSGWDKAPPAPMLPENVISETAQRYVTAFERLSGRKLA
ncbi:MAG: phosphoribosylaminoimidazolesuccinocarboxamide synthase [Dehalococcoidia bacterium]|nr:phosphoribosylaminoimidazolesuccinocarboxamide synthase [Dehalococcoidia bacterium]